MRGWSDKQSILDIHSGRAETHCGQTGRSFEYVGVSQITHRFMTLMEFKSYQQYFHGIKIQKRGLCYGRFER